MCINICSFSLASPISKLLLIIKKKTPKQTKQVKNQIKVILQISAEFFACFDSWDAAEFDNTDVTDNGLV